MNTVIFHITAVCGGCGPNWWRGYAETAPTFPSRTDALDQLATDYLWRTVRTANGAHALLCPACASLEDCARDGHTWVPLIYTLDGVEQQYGQVCGHCSVVRGGDEPAGEHPESLDVELPPEQEALLAEIEDREFPEDDATYADGVREALHRLGGGL